MDVVLGLVARSRGPLAQHGPPKPAPADGLARAACVRCIWHRGRVCRWVGVTSGVMRCVTNYDSLTAHGSAAGWMVCHFDGEPLRSQNST